MSAVRAQNGNHQLRIKSYKQGYSRSLCHPPLHCDFTTLESLRYPFSIRSRAQDTPAMHRPNRVQSSVVKPELGFAKDLEKQRQHWHKSAFSCSHKIPVAPSDSTAEQKETHVEGRSLQQGILQCRRRNHFPVSCGV